MYETINALGSGGHIACDARVTMPPSDTAVTSDAFIIEVGDEGIVNAVKPPAIPVTFLGA